MKPIKHSMNLMEFFQVWRESIRCTGILEECYHLSIHLLILDFCHEPILIFNPNKKEYRLEYQCFFLFPSELNGNRISVLQFDSFLSKDFYRRSMSLLLFITFYFLSNVFLDNKREIVEEYHSISIVVQ